MGWTVLRQCLKRQVQQALGPSFLILRPGRHRNPWTSSSAMRRYSGCRIMPHCFQDCLPVLPRGILAVQMPAMNNEPARTIQAKVASPDPWSQRLCRVTSAPPILDPTADYDLLAVRSFRDPIDLLRVRFSHFGTATASNPYCRSIFCPAGDKIYMASLQASDGASFRTKTP